MNLKQSAKQRTLCRWFPWFQDGGRRREEEGGRGRGEGIKNTLENSERNPEDVCTEPCALFISGVQLLRQKTGSDCTRNVAFVDYSHCLLWTLLRKWILGNPGAWHFGKGVHCYFKRGQ